MSGFLVFRLYGPMVSWGDVAVGGTRPSNDHPTRSAVMGLVAGALGLRRDQEDLHRQLDRALAMAVYAWSTGQLLRDYHTIQTPHRRKDEHYRTRGDELNATKVGTVLSQRDYRCDALYDICLWQTDVNAPYDLAQIQQALRNPKFVLYLGRKSCPISLPLAPVVIEAADCLQALRAMQAERAPTFSIEQDLIVAMDDAKGRSSRQDSLYWEGEPDVPVQALQTATRRDRPLSRRRWQFTSRDEHFALVKREL